MELTINSQKIWLCNQAVDFRMSIDGLSALVGAQFNQLPTDGLYVFYNRNKDKLKLLAWHGNGFVLLYKRLERGRFKFSRNTTTLSTLDKTQLSWLLAGLDWEAMTN